MNTMKTEIGQLAKAISALTSYPRLVRRGYWIAQIERLLEERGISASDRQRLDTLLDLLRNTPGGALCHRIRSRAHWQPGSRVLTRGDGSGHAIGRCDLHVDCPPAG
ncbi:hypothetical protein GCT13_24790 [Paraburkholderia sp. CNPSo 3157]|uniref:Uncharacterized protein n=1 Tax=Paraburkholderia franconis TaxID=2654983 RepID=A0A7X1TI50_9BURK|nr:hypothetical protein [Paraburkholderia franconis]